VAMIAVEDLHQGRSAAFLVAWRCGIGNANGL
jgi:hypothetical protein